MNAENPRYALRKLPRKFWLRCVTPTITSSASRTIRNTASVGAAARARSSPNRPGGRAGNVAVWAAHAGSRRRTHGRGGSDTAGALIRDELIRLGADPAVTV